jgi:hypothetical protein
MTSLYDRAAADFPSAWRPTKKGDGLVGELVDRSTRTSDFGGYEILTVRQEDGTELAWHAFHTAGAYAIQRQDPRVGDRIAIVYHGKGEATEGKQAPHLYRIALERGSTAVEVTSEDAEIAAKEAAYLEYLANGGAEEEEKRFAEQAEERPPLQTDEIPY